MPLPKGFQLDSGPHLPAGFQMDRAQAPDFFSNPKGEGIYEMYGETAPGDVTKVGPVRVPYSKVPSAQQYGYTFLGAESGQRYAKDKAAEGQHPSALSRAGAWIDKELQATPNRELVGVTIGGTTIKLPAPRVLDNTDRAALRVVAGLPSYLKNLYVAAVNMHNGTDTQTFVGMIDPAQMGQGLYDQFMADWNGGDHQLAVQNLIGTLVGLAGVGYAGGKAADFVGDTVPDALKEKGRATLKKMGGVHPMDLEEASRGIVEANKADADKFQKQLDTANQEHRWALLKLKQAHEAAVREAKADYDAAVAKRGADTLKLKQKYEADTRAADEAFRTQTAAAEKVNAETQRAYNRKIGEAVEKNRKIEAARRAATDRQAALQVKGSQLIGRVRRLSAALRLQGDGMYEAVRAKVGDASVPRSDLQSIVQSAQKQWIRGSPEKIREFQEILRNPGAPSGAVLVADQVARSAGYDDFQQAHELADPQTLANIQKQLPADVWNEAIAQAGKPLSWNDMQGFYEETGAKLASGNLPGDVYQAVKQVHDALGERMQTLAQEHGAGADFARARKFYREYMQTFHEATGPSGSGSPVAQVLVARDPLAAARIFQGAAGDRGIAMLRRYDPEVANLAQDLTKAAREKMPAPRAEKTSLGSIPKPAETKAPAGANRPLPPVLPPEVSGPHQPLPPVLPPEPGEYMAAPAPRSISSEELREAQNERMRQRGMKLMHGSGSDYMLTGGVSTWAVAEMLRGEYKYGGALAAARLVLRLPKIGIARLLVNPEIRDWLTSPTKAEVRVYQALPADQKAVFSQSIQRIIPEAKASGLKVSPWWIAAGAAAATPKGLAPRAGNPTDEWSTPQP